MTGRTWGLLLVLSFLWGGSFFFIEVALAGLPPLTLVLARVALAALALYAVLRATGVVLPSGPRLWAAFLVLGLINNVVPFSLIVWGQTRIGGGLASILNCTTPLWGVLLAHLLTRDDRMTTNRLAGVTLGFAGVVVMIGPAAIKGLGADAPAQLAIVAASLSYALGSLFGRRFRGLDPMVIATGQLASAAVLMLPVALALDRPWTLPPPGVPVWAALAGLAVASTALAYVLYFRILAAAGATNILLVTFLVPPSALLLNAVFLGERLDAGQLLGMAMIGLGLAAIDGRLAGALRRRRAPADGV